MGSPTSGDGSRGSEFGGRRSSARSSPARRSEASAVFSSDVGGRKSEVFGSEVEARRLAVGSQRSEVGGRTRERDGGLQPPIERLVYIYPDNVGPRVLSIF